MLNFRMLRSWKSALLLCGVCAISVVEGSRLQEKAGQQQMDAAFDMYDVEEKLLLREEPVASDYGSHEHGVAALTLVAEQGELVVALTSPAVNLLGFEHPAITSSEQLKFQWVNDKLKQFNQLFDVPTSAQCVVKDFSVEWLADQGFLRATSDFHSDIESVWTLKCEQPDQLNQFNIQLFAAFPKGLKRIKADWFTEERAATVLLHSDSTVALNN